MICAVENFVHHDCSKIPILSFMTIYTLVGWLEFNGDFNTVYHKCMAHDYKKTGAAVGHGTKLKAGQDCGTMVRVSILLASVPPCILHHLHYKDRWTRHFVSGDERYHKPLISCYACSLQISNT